MTKQHNTPLSVTFQWLMAQSDVAMANRDWARLKELRARFAQLLRDYERQLSRLAK